MNSPEYGPVEGPEIGRVRAEQLVHELSDAVEEVRHHVVNRGASSIVSEAEKEFPQQVGRLKDAVAAARGLPIEGGTTSTAYYVSDGERYTRGLLGLPHGIQPHYFEGVVHSVGEIPVPSVARYVSRLCLGIAPLSTLQGPLFDTKMDAHYKHFGRFRQLHHPFDKQEYQDQILYLPIDSASDKGIQLLSTWQAQA